MIEYEDFSLKIEPRRGDTYPVIVLRSPAGEGRSEFSLPFNADQLGEVLSELSAAVRGLGPAPERKASPAATLTRPQWVGDKLFSAIFSGPVLSLFDRSTGMLHGSERGLRIKIHIDPEDPSLANLASLPWEFIYRKDTRDFLNLSKFTPVVRYLDVQRPHAPLPLERPLRILVVISDPADYVGLNVERERALIEKTWAQHEGVQVDFMERASILALQRRLGRESYHVLHYMGHGAFDEYSGEGVLVMEKENRLGQLVDGSSLGVLLRDVRTMRLVFLNACDTARVTKEQGADPFAGVASAMVMAGIPAVVAMQFPISDEAAITFSGSFYPLLAQGSPVDVAVAEGRRAVRLANSRTMEWGTPVLFMRAPKGDIFRVRPHRVAGPDKAKPLETEPWEAGSGVSEGQAERLYRRGLSAFRAEAWDAAIASFEAVLSMHPDYADVRERLAEAERQSMLHGLYSQAQAAEVAGDRSKAILLLESLIAEEPNFKDAASWLEVARLETAKERETAAAKPATLPIERAEPHKPTTLPSDTPQPRSDKPTSLPK